MTTTTKMIDPPSGNPLRMEIRRGNGRIQPVHFRASTSDPEKVLKLKLPRGARLNLGYFEMRGGRK